MILNVWAYIRKFIVFVVVLVAVAVTVIAVIVATVIAVTVIIIVAGNVIAVAVVEGAGPSFFKLIRILNIELINYYHSRS